MRKIPASLLAKLGRKLANIRVHLALSQQEIAWRSGLSKVRICMTERHGSNMRLETLLNLANALELSSEDFGSLMSEVYEEYRTGG